MEIRKEPNESGNIRAVPERPRCSGRNRGRGSGKERGVSEGTERFRKEPSGGAGCGGRLCPAGTGLEHHKITQLEGKSGKMSAQEVGRGVSAPFSGVTVGLGLRESRFCNSVMGTGHLCSIQPRSKQQLRSLYKYVFIYNTTPPYISIYIYTYIYIYIYVYIYLYSYIYIYLHL